MKDVRAIGEAFSPQNRTSRTSNMNFFHFLNFWSVYGFSRSMRIYGDPDPEPCWTHSNPETDVSVFMVQMSDLFYWTYGSLHGPSGKLSDSSLMWCTFDVPSLVLHSNQNQKNFERSNLQPNIKLSRYQICNLIVSGQNHPRNCERQGRTSNETKIVETLVSWHVGSHCILSWDTTRYF